MFSLFLLVKFSLLRKWSCYAVKFVTLTSEVKFAHNFAIGRNFTHVSRTSLSKITSLAQRANLVFFIQHVPAIGLFLHKLPNIPTARTNFIFLFTCRAPNFRPVIAKSRHPFMDDFSLSTKASVFDMPRGEIRTVWITVFVKQHGCRSFIPFLHLITY